VIAVPAADEAASPKSADSAAVFTGAKRVHSVSSVSRGSSTQY
jgi:hypothetical protein